MSTEKSFDYNRGKMGWCARCERQWSLGEHGVYAMYFLPDVWSWLNAHTLDCRRAFS